MEFLYLVFTGRPGGVTVSNAGLCWWDPCLLSAFISIFLFILHTTALHTYRTTAQYIYHTTALPTYHTTAYTLTTSAALHTYQITIYTHATPCLHAIPLLHTFTISQLYILTIPQPTQQPCILTKQQPTQQPSILTIHTYHGNT